MKLRTLLVLNAAVALVFGVPLVLTPGTIGIIYGLAPTPETNLLAQYFGVELIAVGLLTWLARNVADVTMHKAMVLAFLVANTIGLIVSLLGVLAGVFNSTGWSAVLLYLVFTVGYGYFQFMSGAKS